MEQEAENIKKQLINHIENTFPKDKQQQAISQIKSMNNQQLEQFLKQNNLLQSNLGNQQQCPFCLITHGKLNAYKIDENESSLAVLEINPLSKGHTIIIPKNHVSSSEIPEQALTLAKKVSQKLKTKLNPKEVQISTSEVFNHAIINVIPIYENKKLEKKKAEESELKSLQEKILKEEIQKKEPEKKAESKPKKLPKAPKRIP